MTSSSAPVRLALLVLAALMALGGFLVRASETDDAPGDRLVAAAPGAHAVPARPAPYAARPGEVRIAIGFKRPPRSGLLFELRGGRVLWSRGPARRRPIASLTKMMTALLVADRSRPGERVLITRQALDEPGSQVGLLPPHRSVRLETLLYGLLLPSGNDAAVALAQHVGGTVPRFVADMNAEAHRLGLRCTHFSSPDGLEDRGNRSCARDLAVLAREILVRRRLARIVRTSVVALPALVPHTAKRGRRKRTVWRPGRLWLVNNNPLLRTDYRGTTGVKTGYTDAAGRCLVATVRRGRTVLGVVLLHSPDPGYQAMRLFNRGFRALRLRRARSAVASPIR
ncbi:MAG: D-alanyl-D-alanine carboxypeptidase family protein [Solirubrobacteraceae bacterium]